MNNALRIAGIIKESIVDGPGIRFVVFAQGCPHNCDGCHNPQTHDFNGGKLCEIDKLLQEIDKNPLISGVTFSGGEPFCQAKALALLAKEVKKRGLNIFAYSGYTFEELVNMQNEAVAELLSLCDVLVDGRYIKGQRNLMLKFRGSENQRIIDVQKSLQQGRAVVIEDI
ncbi:MAG TPA: anaerobic ribonucleoside-triphosphate reductase activating protein [Ruminococcaceae bacterium]|nr:anaerobic ribonucleoside-triphosphate reductase activating protein [Oscillospiraceae bacterium]